jgi:hypothetical protein
MATTTTALLRLVATPPQKSHAPQLAAEARPYRIAKTCEFMVNPVDRKIPRYTQNNESTKLTYYLNRHPEQLVPSLAKDAQDLAVACRDSSLRSE